MEASRRVLVAEDYVPLRALIEYTLATAGFQVVAVSSGREALRRIRTERFDLVLTDVCLPDLDGVELLMQLRADANMVPVIAMSGGPAVLGDPANLLKIAHHLGAVCTISKPFSIDEMIRAVHATILARSG